MDAAPPPMESHGQFARVSPADAFQFHLVFSNKTESDALCLGIWTELTARGVQVWQQKKNIPKDSDNWFSEWFPSANVAIKVVCFLTVAYLKSIYCMKEFRVAQALDKLLVVICEPMQAIRAVDPGQYPHASDALAYLLGGGQVIFHDTDDVVGEIVKFLPREMAASEPEPEPAAIADGGGLGQPPTAAPPKPGGIRTLAEFAAAVDDIDSVEDLLECSAEEMAELFEEHAALLKSGVMGRKQREKLLKEHAGGASADAVAGSADAQAKEQQAQVAAVEAKYKALMEKQAAALQRQQSELNRSAAALHQAEKDLMDSTRVKAEEDAASVALAIKLVEEEQAQATARQEAERNAADVVAQRPALEKKFEPDSTDADVRRYLEELGAAAQTLASLSLKDCEEVTDAGVSAVGAGCPQLTSLHLDSCDQVTDVGVSAVGAGCPQLTSLSLDRCWQVTGAGLSAVGAGCPQLGRWDSCC